MDFYKANLLKINKLTKPSRFIYLRLGNASTIYLWYFEITWRRSWLPQTAYQMGWDAAFRQFHGIDESGRTLLAPDAPQARSESDEN